MGFFLCVFAYFTWKHCPICYDFLLFSWASAYASGADRFILIDCDIQEIIEAFKNDTASIKHSQCPVFRHKHCHEHVTIVLLTYFHSIDEFVIYVTFYRPLRMELDGSLTCERVIQEIIEAFKSEHAHSSSPGKPSQNAMSAVPNIAMSTCPPESSHLKIDANGVNFATNDSGDHSRTQIGRTRTDSTRPQIHNALLLESPRYGAGGRPHARQQQQHADRLRVPRFAAGANANLSPHVEGDHDGVNGSAHAAPVDFRLKYDTFDHYELRMVDEDDFSPDMDFPALQVRTVCFGLVYHPYSIQQLLITPHFLRFADGQ